MRFIPLIVIAFILTGALFLSSCESDVNKPCDTCSVCDTCDTTDPCDTCDTTIPCDTCDTTKADPDSLAHAFTWTEYSIPEEAKLTGCYVSNNNFIQIIGTYFYQWDGQKWQKQPQVVTSTQTEAEFTDFSMFCLNSNQRWMVGYGTAYFCDAGIATRYDPGSVNACWGTSTTNMFFVGNGGNIQHFNGEKFTKFPQVTTKPLYSIWGTSNNDVWAAGFDESTAESVLLHYDGNSWVEQDLKQIGDIRPFKHALGEVWATDSSGHKIVVASGSLLHRRTDNGPWRSDSGLVKNYFGGGFIGLWHTSGNNINDFSVAGDGGFISHWNGKTWMRYDELYNPGDPLYITDAIHQKGNTICVAGKKSGSGWIAIGKRKP